MGNGFPRKWQQTLYRIYRSFIRLCILIATAADVLGFISRAFVLDEGMDAVVFDVIFLPFWVYVLPNLWSTLKNEYSNQGYLLELVQQAVSCGYTWDQATHSLKYVYVGLLISNLLLWGTYTPAYFTSDSWSWRVAEASGPDSMWEWVKIIDVLSTPAYSLLMTVGIVFAWQASFTCGLYTHDLHCYAAAVIRICDDPPSIDEAVVSLSKIELGITQRFRRANSSWIRPIICAGFYGVFLALLSCMMLVANQGLGAYDQAMLAFFVGLGICIFVMAIQPLTAVAETQEYDVLRELNNPQTIAASRPLIGDLLLAHLQSLEWGFRFGGSLIDNRKLSSSLAGLVVTAIASVCQATLSSAAET